MIWSTRKPPHHGNGHKPLFEAGRVLGLVGVLGSAFDLSRRAFLETLNVPLYKIASVEMTDIRVILEALVSVTKRFVIRVFCRYSFELDGVQKETIKLCV